MAEPNFDTLDREALQSEAIKYFRACRARGQKLDVYRQVIAALTDRPAEDFVRQEDAKTFVVNDDNIFEFKRGGEGGDLVRRANLMLAAAQAKIRDLEHDASSIQREHDRAKAASASKIKALEEQMKQLTTDDPVERRRSAFVQLFARRQPIPVKDVKVANDTQAQLLSQLWSNEYVVTTHDGRDKLFAEQREVELSIVEECLEYLRLIFDDLPRGVTRVDKGTIAVEVEPVLDILLETRTRLSYVMGERAFGAFLREHIGEISNTLDLLNSRARDPKPGEMPSPDLRIRLSPYEKGLLWHKAEQSSESYLACYERPIDIQRRILVCARGASKLNPFGPFEEFPSSFVYAQPEDVIKAVLLTSRPVNNIAFIPGTGAGGPDYWSFFLLEAIKGHHRIWKLDPHAIYLTRFFQHHYLQMAERIFKTFYRDVMGHNEYKPDLEATMEAKGVERWKQMKVLYENIQVVADEYLLGEIIRRIIRTHATHYPLDDVDQLQGDRDPPDAQADFKRVRERWRAGLPPCNEEPEDWLNHAFDKYKAWRPEHTAIQYRQRWHSYLDQHGMIQR